jgi:hypothetical protein
MKMLELKLEWNNGVGRGRFLTDPGSKGGSGGWVGEGGERMSMRLG